MCNFINTAQNSLIRLSTKHITEPEDIWCKSHEKPETENVSRYSAHSADIFNNDWLRRVSLIKKPLTRHVASL